jgi:hypothetical protein
MNNLCFFEVIYSFYFLLDSLLEIFTSHWKKCFIYFLIKLFGYEKYLNPLINLVFSYFKIVLLYSNYLIFGNLSFRKNFINFGLNLTKFHFNYRNKISSQLRNCYFLKYYCIIQFMSMFNHFHYSIIIYLFGN